MARAPEPHGESHLFYQTAHPRPRLARAEGIYLWSEDGRRFIDASSGPMVSNIGHSNPRVLAAMKAQMVDALNARALAEEIARSHRDALEFLCGEESVDARPLMREALAAALVRLYPEAADML